MTIPMSSGADARLGAVALTLVLTLTGGLRSQCIVDHLVAPDPINTGTYGASLVLADGLAVVGDGTGLFGGAPSYVFEREDGVWMQDAAPLMPGNITYSYGHAVAIEGDTVIVAGQDFEVPGYLGFVFERQGDTWVETGSLFAEDAWFNLGGGTGVALEDGIALVADAMTQVVWAFLRQGDDWVLFQTLEPDEKPFSQSFGYTVALQDGRAVVGGSDYDGVQAPVGTAWVFELQDGLFVQTGKLNTVEGEPGDGAGTQLAMDGDTIVLGAHNHDHFAGENLQIGAAFVFELVQGDWTQTQFITAPDPRTGDLFGWSVALQDDTLLIGAPDRDKGALRAGAVYVYHREASGHWDWTATLTDDEPQQYARFGRAVAIDGETALVSVPFGEGPAVRVLRGVTDLHHWGTTPGFVVGAEGRPCLYGDGDPMVGRPATLTLERALAGAPAWLVVGLARLKLPFKGGILVPSPDLILPLTTDVAGGFQAGWIWPAGVPEDTRLWFQTWIADDAAIQGFAASNAVTVEVP